MSSFTNDLTAGAAAYVAAHSAVTLTWTPSGNYSPGAPWPITVGRMADQGQVIAVNAWGGVPDHRLADFMQPLQFKYRGNGTDSASVNTAADSVFDVLEMLTDVALNGIHVVKVAMSNSIPLGIDEAGRYMRSDNWFFYCNRPNLGRPL